MRDLNTLNDAAMLRRHSRLVAADLAERAKPPRVRQPVHAMCLAMSEVYQLAPTNAEIVQQAHARLSQQPAEADAQALLRHTRAGLRRMLDGNEAFHVDPMAVPVHAVGDGVIDDTAAVQAGAPLRAGARLPTDTPADVWHTEAPTVSGVYDTRNPYGRHPRHWNGHLWSRYLIQGECAVTEPRMSQDRSAETQWLRLIEADTPAIADWRPGDQVPEGERTGLWHFWAKSSAWRSEPREAMCASRLGFCNLAKYRPAAPGVRAGDAYDEARYAQGAA